MQALWGIRANRDHQQTVHPRSQQSVYLGIHQTSQAISIRGFSAKVSPQFLENGFAMAESGFADMGAGSYRLPRTSDVAAFKT